MCCAEGSGEFRIGNNWCGKVRIVMSVTGGVMSGVFFYGRMVDRRVSMNQK